MEIPEEMRHVAFDWGGVFTVGTFDGRSTQRIAERSAVPLDLIRQSYFRHVAQLEVGAWELPRFWEALRQETGLTLEDAELEALYLGSIHDNAAMYDTLAALPAQVRVGLLSNNYPVVSDHLRRDPRFARFDALVFSNEIGHKKPALQAFARLEAALRVPAARVAFVDDVPENVAAACAYGFHGILYHHENHAAFEKELAAWLGG